MLGFSAKTIRRDIASMPDDVRKMSLACPSDVPVMSLTEYGLKWLAEKHRVPFSGSSSDGSSGQQEEKQESENELVLSLLEQLRQKDIQIAEKDKQIAQLMEQAKNYQVLLQAQQVLSLPAPKRSFFKRSLSARRAWIEIRGGYITKIDKDHVALRKESVDRNL